MATITELEERVERLEREVTDLKDATAPRKRTFYGFELTDNNELVRMFDEVISQLGLPTGGPVLPADEVRRLMVEHGVRPEDRLFTTGLRELRGEE